MRPKRTAIPVQSTFESGVLPAYRGLARRLADGNLRLSERQALERTKRVLRLRGQGLSLRVIAVELDTTEDTLKKFTGRGVFRTIAQFLHLQEATPDARIQGARRQQERRRFDKFAPDALDYFDAAFAKDANGEYVDPNRAERAAFHVAKSQGWTEPLPPPARRVQPLSGAVIQASMRAIAECDARMTRPLQAANGSPSSDE